MRIRSGLWVVALLVACAAIAGVQPPDGTADYETTRKGAPMSKGKLYTLGKRFRSETEARGMKMTMIMDTDAKKMWMVMPPPTGCIEQTMAKEGQGSSFAFADSDSKEERVGRETIDGHPTEKFRLTMTHGSSTLVHYVWRATDLQGYPIQTSDEAGTSTTKFKNIVLGKPDTKLLEPPADCKAMPSFGEMQKQMPQQMPQHMPKRAPAE